MGSGRRNLLQMSNKFRLTLWGFILCNFGLLLYLSGVLFALPRRLIWGNNLFLKEINMSIVWYSGIPMLIGFFFILIDLFVIKKQKNKKSEIPNPKKFQSQKITVALTSYNDELSIARAVKNFRNHPNVKRVIVISNNSNDKTLQFARKAGAIAYNEELQGYGSCVHRALTEGIKFNDTKFTLLCEGDLTFRAFDVDKFLAYIPHADIVNGTRVVDQLKCANTQLSTFMYYGNFFVAKLLEMKHIGKCTLSDVGTTYKLCRNSALKKLLPILNPHINLEFNPYFLDHAIELGLEVVECPITFHRRVGESKGGNKSNFIAFKLGIRMIMGILFSWKKNEKA